MKQLSTVVASLALIAGIASGASAQDKPVAQPTATPAAKKSAPAKVAKLANETKSGKAMCPIMNHEFAVKASSPKATYKGKDYAFCCAGCKPEFEKNPTKYVKAETKSKTKPTTKKGT